MPYYHCRKCQHEFEHYGVEEPICDWCGANRPRMLEEKTPLEKLAENSDKLLKMLQGDG